MDDDSEPAFITTLMSPDTSHDCYFVVGDPFKGEVERIGVVSTMLMAHSLMFRRLLGDNESDLDNRWDITLTSFTPKIFKMALKYTYGHKKYNYPLPELVELLNLSEYLSEFQLSKDMVKQILKNLESGADICLALKNPICLTIESTKEQFSIMILERIEKVLASPNFLDVCPDSLRFIEDLDGLEVSKTSIWRAVVKWARHKVLGEEHQPHGPLKQLAPPRFIPPSLKHVRLCTLNVIGQVEKALSMDSKNIQDKSYFKEILPIYHKNANTPGGSVIVCTHNKDDHHLTHEEFDLKVILDCSAWMNMIFRKESEITIQTKDSALELYSLVCSGCKKNAGELNDMRDRMLEAEREGEFPTDYYCRCYVRIGEFSGEGLRYIADITFRDFVEFDEEFQVILLRRGRRIVLAPKRKYKLSIKFPSDPHPLWFANDSDYLSPKESSEPDIQCGLISKTNNWYGSHAKYLLYREMSSLPL